MHYFLITNTLITIATIINGRAQITVVDCKFLFAVKDLNLA